MQLVYVRIAIIKIIMVRFIGLFSNRVKFGYNYNYTKVPR